VIAPSLGSRGANHETTNEPFEAFTSTDRGADVRRVAGVCIWGVKDDEASDAADEPAVFTATTVTVWAVPFDSPARMQLVTATAVQVAPSELVVTTYESFGSPYTKAGVHET
jgi:hypothetical protein